MTNNRRRATRTQQHRETGALVSLGQRVLRWCLRTVVALGVLMLVVAIGKSGQYVLSLPVERIVINGELQSVDRLAIESSVAAYTQTGLLAVDLDGVQSLLEQHAWVYRASVRRRWPDTLVIDIAEQRPIALWGDSGYINHEGEFFPAPTDSRWSDLPTLNGPEDSQKALIASYQSLDALLAGTGIGIVRLDRDDVDQTRLELDRGVAVLLGDQRHAERMRRFVSLIERHLDLDTVASVDLRYPNGAAVTLAEPHVAAVASDQKEFH